jgi:hypothetical protein
LLPILPWFQYNFMSNIISFLLLSDLYNFPTNLYTYIYVFTIYEISYIVWSWILLHTANDQEWNQY